MAKATKEGLQKVTWPFDPEAAKKIECHTVKGYRCTLYVWKPDNKTYWSYTLSAGHNSDRSHTGSTETGDFDSVAAKGIEAANEGYL
jgi:hypothetical protein